MNPIHVLEFPSVAEQFGFAAEPLPGITGPVVSRKKTWLIILGVATVGVIVWRGYKKHQRQQEELES